MGKSSSYKKKRSKNSSQVVPLLSLYTYLHVCLLGFSVLLLLNCKRLTLCLVSEKILGKNSKFEVLKLMPLCLLVPANNNYII